MEKKYIDNSLYLYNSYLKTRFPLSLQNTFQDILPDCWILILHFLPEESSRKKYRKITKLIADSNYITVYWYRDPLFIMDQMAPFILKRENRDFVKMWFQILESMEDSQYVKTIYHKILKHLSYKRHTRLIVIHNSYVQIENIKIHMHFNNAINLFLG